MRPRPIRRMLLSFQAEGLDGSRTYDLFIGTVEFQQDLTRFSNSRQSTTFGEMNCPTIILSCASGLRRNKKMDQIHTKTRHMSNYSAVFTVIIPPQVAPPNMGGGANHPCLRKTLPNRHWEVLIVQANSMQVTRSLQPPFRQVPWRASPSQPFPRRQVAKPTPPHGTRRGVETGHTPG